MSKIKVNSIIHSNNEEDVIVSCYGIKNDNLITYKDNSAFVNILLTKNFISITRENDEFKLKLCFKNNGKCTSDYFIKDISLNIEVLTNTKRLEIDDNKITIEYELFLNGELSDVFVYTMEWSDL